MNVITNTEMAKVAINKSLLKEYDNRVVYLKNGDEFQIQLFNPKTTTIAAEILINGHSYGAKLVIRPGERIWLERYLDRPNKFKFTTYEVEDSPEVADAIKNNGKIVVKFYDEVVKRSAVWCLTEPIYYTEKYYTSPHTISAGDSGSFGSSIVTNAISDYSFTSSASAACTYEIEASVAKSVKETGIIEDGSHSNQDFHTVNNEFAFYPFKTEEIQVYPVSQKPVYSEDIQKVYCTECGRKLQAKYKFCPFCGTQV